MALLEKCNSQRFRNRVGGRGLATHKPPKRQEVLQKCVPLLLRRHRRKKGTEKRPECPAYEGFPRANPPLPANPFSKLLKQCHVSADCQARKRNPNPNFPVWISSGGGRGLPREGVGAKKCGMSLETRAIKRFWRDIPGSCRDIPGAAQKV